MAIKHILFDLDGTLLPMVQDEFVRFYMPLLAKAYLKKGVEMDPKGFIGAVWKGYEAMVKNDGSGTNREAFGVILMNSCRFLWKNQRQSQMHFMRMNSIRPNVRHSRHHSQIWL